MSDKDDEKQCFQAGGVGGRDTLDYLNIVHSLFMMSKHVSLRCARQILETYGREN